MDTKPTVSVIEYGKNFTDLADMTDDEKIDFVATRILEKYKPAFLELAK